MIKHLKIIAIATGIAISVNVNAQDGTLDVSFGTNGIVTTVDAHEAFDMVIQPDNKIIVVGSIYMGSGNDDMAVVRYNSDGSLDNSFGTNGIVNVDFNGKNDDASSVLLQNDGKIVVVGRAQNSSNNNSDIAAIRLNSDGALDNTFATSGKYQLDIDGYAYDYALGAALQSDGKIVLVAIAGTDMFAKTAVVRLNANGALDNTFDGDGILKAFSFGAYTMSSLHSIALQNDGKILIAGSANNNFAVARLNSDGSLDATYATNGYFQESDMATESKLYIQNDGKLLATYSHITQTNVKLIRLNQDGTKDTSFGTNGKVSTQIGTTATYDYGKDLAIQPNGKIVVTGSAYSSGSVSDFLVVRYNSDGTLDTNFGLSGDGIVTTSVASIDSDRGKAIELQSDGKIVVAGSPCTGSCDFVLLRYNNTDVSVGIADNFFLSTDFAIYPNPTNSILNIKVKETTNIIIVNMLGATVATQKLNAGNNSIDVSTLTKGIYFVQSSNGGAVKFIKE